MKRALRILGLLLAAILFCAPALAYAGENWLNTDIDGAVTGDTPVARPQDDFNLAVNRDYIMNLVIPEGNYAIGGFFDANFAGNQMKLDAIQDDTLTGHDAELVRQYYNLLMDWDTRNALGVSPAQPYLDQLRAIDSLEAMTAWMADSDVGGLAAYEDCGGCLFSYGVSASKDDPSARVMTIAPTGLSLGDAAEYRELSENGKIVKAQMTAGWTAVLKHLGFSEAEAAQMIENTFAFEALMAARQDDRDTRQNPENIGNYWNPTDLAGIEALCGDFPADRILKGWGVDGANQYNAHQPAYLKALGEIYTEDNLEIMRDWLTVRATEQWMGNLDKATRDDVTDAENAVRGIQGVESDEMRASKRIYADLVVPADNLYITKHCTPQMRDDIRQIIEAVIADYRKMLQEEDWLTEATRDKAIEKLEHITVRAVYPDDLETWDDLEFPVGGNLLEASLAASRYVRDRALRKVNEPVDRTEWDRGRMPTSTTNAYYSPSDNSINILAGILISPVYQSDYSYEEKLGRIGAIIGHEISHAFDPSGSQYDKDGKFVSWWTDADRAAFDARARKLIDYYDNVKLFDDIRYSGTRVQGEAVADMGGLKCVLHIAAGTEGFDYKKFFEAYARLWSSRILKSTEIYFANVDTHPLAYLRANVTVMQFDEFQKAYDVHEGDGMYLAPEDRICVW